MNVISTPLDGVLIIEPDVYGDHRGFFMETWHHRRYEASGVPCPFVQTNLSFSVRGTLRGLHFQKEKPQAKLIQALTGEVFDVAVDVRPGSSTFGQWTGVTLSEKNRRQFFIPEGFAHGFCVTSETAHFFYLCSEFYAPEDEGGVLWSDPDIGIDWPVEHPVISEKDAKLPPLSELRNRLKKP